MIHRDELLPNQLLQPTSRADGFNGLRHDPHVILLDLHLDDEGGLDMVTQLRERSGAKVIVLTGMRAVSLSEQAVMRGASGVVQESERPEMILKAISRVHAGELWLDRSMSAQVFASLCAKRNKARSPADSPEAALTARDRSIVAALVRYKGAPAKVIADALHMSVHTLRSHLSSIYAKLGVHRRIDLVLYAVEHDLDKDLENTTQ